MYVILLAIMIFISAALSGLFAPPFPEGEKLTIAPDEYKCCDTGDLADCRAQTELPPINFRGEEYALLKSNIYLHDYKTELAIEHLNPVQPTERRGPRNERVFENPTNRRPRPLMRTHYPDCEPGETGMDQLFGQPDPRNVQNPDKPGCYEIPDDLLIYLCRSDSPGSCNGNHQTWDSVKFDVWIRVKDISQGGELGKIPDVITNCFKPELPKQTEEQIVFKPSPGGQKNLQLRTFRFTSEKPPITWLSPYCKPAIYLYPERKTEMNVTVKPKGEMLLTIPEYPKNGWNVVAEPDGDIFHNSTRFDYLYYEASIPDELIHQPKEGYVIPYAERESFMRDLVVKLGLNEKETDQFVEYWAPILPESPYYFIGIVPVTNLNHISPVDITPKPDNFIRITLYFQALDTQIAVKEPVIPTVSRDGFTAVEWGGIFKQDKDHPFSCFM